MFDKNIRNLPNQLPPDIGQEVNDDEVLAEIERLHRSLKLKDLANHQRKTDLFEKHGIMFQGRNDVAMRLNLLIEMFIGHLSPERLRFEIRWADMVAQGLEDGYAEFLEQQRQASGSKELFLPGVGKHVVPPAKENGSDVEKPDEG